VLGPEVPQDNALETAEREESESSLIGAKEPAPTETANADSIIGTGLQHANPIVPNGHMQSAATTPEKPLERSATSQPSVAADMEPVSSAVADEQREEPIVPHPVGHLAAEQAAPESKVDSNDFAGPKADTAASDEITGAE